MFGKVKKVFVIADSRPWNVRYTKPDYTESFDSYFTFAPDE